MLSDLPSGDDEITVRIRLEPARGAHRLADSLPAPASHGAGALAAAAAAALAALVAALVALA